MRFLRPLYDDEINGEGDVEIGNSIFQRSRILLELEPETYQLAFDEWLVERKQDMLSRASDILAEHQLKDRFSQLQRAYKGGCIVPFVGAGLSFPTGYPLWTQVVQFLCKQSEIAPETIDALLANEEYEKAAEALYRDLGAALFDERLQAIYGESRQILGPVQFLPHIFGASHVVTTNFDTILETAYRDADCGFDRVISGKALAETVRLALEGARLLVKMHGHFDTVGDRVLTASEYDRAYANDGDVVSFYSRFLFAKSLLFLGCRLVEDRTVLTMKRMVDTYGAHNLPRHYAFLELKNGGDRVQRQRALAKSNIFPIWYPEGQHDNSIEALLTALGETT